MNFDPLTPEITMLEIVLFGITAKSVYFTKYLRICCTDLHQIFIFARHIRGIINLTFVLQSLSGRRLGNQLILEAKIVYWLKPPSFFALAFHCHLKYSHPNALPNCGDDPFTSYIYLVGIHPCMEVTGGNGNVHSRTSHAMMMMSKRVCCVTVH